MNTTKKVPDLDVAQIKMEKAYREAKERCLKNLTGSFNVQVIRCALMSLEEKLGTKAVGLLAREVPRIKRVVVVPQEYIDSAA